MCSSLETPTPTVSENGAHCAAGGHGAFQVEVEVEESVIIPSPQSFSGMKDRRPEVMVCKCILPVFTAHCRGGHHELGEEQNFRLAS